jgi:hypothetical protein
MDPSLVLAGASAAIWLLFLWLRVPSVLMFFSLLVGQLLATQVSYDAYQWVSALVHFGDVRTVQLILLFLPVFLSLLFLKGRLPRAKMLMEAIPMAFVIAAGLLFAMPFIPGIKEALNEHVDTERYNSLIIICASISSLVSAWFTYPKHDSGKHGKHHG